VDGVVRIWELSDYSLRHEWGLARSVEFDFTPDGQRIVTAVDGEVRLWSAVTGEEVRRYSSEGLDAGFVARDVDVSPSGELIAVDGTGATIALYLTDPPERPAARLADYVVDLRLDGRRVVPREGNLLEARPSFWRPSVASRELLGLTPSRSADDRDRALIAHYISAGNMASALLIWRRLPADAQPAQAPELVDALRRRADRVARGGAVDLALRFCDLAAEVAPLAGPDAPFDAARTRAEILVDADRAKEALAAYALAIETATRQGRARAAKQLAESRLRLLVDRGDLEAAGAQLGALLAMPAYSEASRRARTIRRYLRDVGRDLARGPAGDSTDRLLAVALAEVAIASEGEPSIDLSAIDALTSLVEEARAGTEPVTVLAKGAEWKVWGAARRAPPTDWRASDFDDSAWATVASPIAFAPNSTTPVLQSEDLVKFTRASFSLDLASLPPDHGLSFRFLVRPSGAVFLNGHEIARQGLLTGELTPETPALPLTLTYRTELEDARLTELLRSGNNTVAVQLHRTSKVSSQRYLDFEIVATVTPAAYLRESLGGLETAIAALRDFLPDSMVVDLGPTLRFAFGASISPGSSLEGQAEAWLRRARVQRALGRIDAALKAVERCVKLAEAGSELGLQAKRELDELRTVSRR
jgi:tetratricopeptide (TPR) repeat protein